jgi:hypothetical protein
LRSENPTCNQTATLTNDATPSKREFEQIVYPQKNGGLKSVGQKWGADGTGVLPRNSRHDLTVSWDG